MTFKHFLFSYLSPNGQEAAIGAFLSRFSSDVNFPDTENIRELAEYFYAKLDQDSTSAFQKLLIFWQMNSGDAPNPSVLNEVNYIIELQTNDRDYGWSHQIPAHINNR